VVAKNKTKHTLRLTLDIYNLTNLLNKDWGLYQGPSAGSGTAVQNIGIIKYDKLDTDGKTPIFSFPYADGVNQIPYTNSFKNDISIASRWQMQLGIRYIFN